MDKIINRKHYSTEAYHRAWFTGEFYHTNQPFDTFAKDHRDALFYHMAEMVKYPRYDELGAKLEKERRVDFDELRKALPTSEWNVQTSDYKSSDMVYTLLKAVRKKVIRPTKK